MGLLIHGGIKVYTMLSKSATGAAFTNRVRVKNNNKMPTMDRKQRPFSTAKELSLEQLTPRLHAQCSYRWAKRMWNWDTGFSDIHILFVKVNTQNANRNCFTNTKGPFLILINFNHSMDKWPTRSRRIDIQSMSIRACFLFGGIDDPTYIFKRWLFLLAVQRWTRLGQ